MQALGGAAKARLFSRNYKDFQFRELHHGSIPGHHLFFSDAFINK
jgi:hypothetical protein